MAPPKAKVMIRVSRGMLANLRRKRRHPTTGCLPKFIGGRMSWTKTSYLPDAGCALPVFKSIPDFGLVAQDEDRYSTAVDVARLRTFSFFVHNLGPHPVLVQLEMSPDGVSWSPFGEMLYELGAGEKQLLVPQYFLRFARIRFRSAQPGSPSVLTVWFQGQS